MIGMIQIPMKTTLVVLIFAFSCVMSVPLPQNAAQDSNESQDSNAEKNGPARILLLERRECKSGYITGTFYKLIINSKTINSICISDQ